MSKKTFAALLLFAGVGLTSLHGQTAHAAPGIWHKRIVYATHNDQEIPAQLATRFNVVHNDKGITIRMEMKDPHAADLKTLKKGRDGQWPSVESVELFFDPGRTCGKYFQIAVGADGSRWDRRWLKKEKTKWTSKLEITKTGWNVTVFLPYSDPGMMKAKVGDEWGFNFCRNIVSKKNGGRYFSTWAHVGTVFNRPERFGTLVFGSPAAAKRAKNVKIRKAYEKLVANLKKRGIAKEFTVQLKKMDEDCTESQIRDIYEEAEMVEKLKGIK